MLRLLPEIVSPVQAVSPPRVKLGAAAVPWTVVESVAKVAPDAVGEVYWIVRGEKLVKVLPRTMTENGKMYDAPPPAGVAWTQT